MVHEVYGVVDFFAVKGGIAMDTLSHYTGGADGWGDLVSVCADCGETVARYACDGDGNPVDAIFDNTDTYRCG